MIYFSGMYIITNTGSNLKFKVNKKICFCGGPFY